MLSCGSPEKSGEDDTDTSMEKPVRASAKTTDPTTASVSVSDAQIPLESVGLVDNTLHREPAKGEWKGETFNDLASAQLKALGKLMKKGENAITTTSLEPFAIESVQTDALVPSNLEVAYDNADLIVKRGSSSGPGAANREELAVALQNLASWNGLRSEFKIFGVRYEESITAPQSTVRVQFSGENSDGVVGHRSTWICDWKWDSPESPPLLTKIKITEFEEVISERKNETEDKMFSDATATVFQGVDSFEPQFNRGMDHWVARLEMSYGIGLSGWHGLALGDANGDGLDDLYVCEPGGLPNRLYIRKADGTLLDASALSGTDFRLQTQSALFIDLDNDADQDLVIATTLGVIFMANDGRGNFTVKANKLVPEAPPVALAAADFDLDGDLDIYVGCYSLRRSSATGDARQILGRPVPYHDANNGGRNVIFRNERNWTFTNATRDLGLDENNRRFTLASSWEDYDDDGDPDLYVANDYGRNNLYRNDSDGEGNVKFTDVAKEAGVEDISAGMSVSWGDADGDGDRDLYVSNMWSSAGNRITYQRNFQNSAESSVLTEIQRHARGNSLFLNNGDGSFNDASVEAGVTMGRWAWGSLFTDINNDGREDIVVANGFITQPDDTGDL